MTVSFTALGLVSKLSAKWRLGHEQANTPLTNMDAVCFPLMRCLEIIRFNPGWTLESTGSSWLGLRCRREGRAGFGSSRQIRQIQ